jgi:hypothetical protein
MSTNFFLKSVAFAGATIGCFLASQSFALAQDQTTGTGTTLQELQGSAGSEPSSTLDELQSSSGDAPANNLQTLQERAATLEAERNSRTPSTTPESATFSGDANVVAQVSTATGKTTVVLVNTIGTAVTYEVIGQTPPRTLAAGANVRLDALPMPVTLTVRRQDTGLLEMAAEVSDTGLLTVTLSPTDFNQLEGALTIREDGYVSIN